MELPAATLKAADARLHALLLLQPESQDASTASKAQDTAGWATDGVKAAAHTVTRKAKEALGMEKPSAGPHTGESQEPAGAMESRSLISSCHWGDLSPPPPHLVACIC